MVVMLFFCCSQATTYTCPLYACILSFLVSLDEEVVGKRMLCFSYGSGCAASMFGLRIKGVPLYPADIIDRLQTREPKTVNEALKLVAAFEDTYGKFGFEPSHVKDRQDGAYYLQHVSAAGVRTYTCHRRSLALRIEKSADMPVTWIEFQQEVINEEFLTEL